MDATTTFGVDIAKSVMQLHWVEPATGEIKRKKLTRSKFVEFFAQRQRGLIALEACGGAHHWARTLMALGHQVELLSPRAVRPFVTGNKDDAADARAIWMAAQHGDIRRVPVKSCSQQAVLSLHRVRKHWVDVRTATINMLRGLLYEFGIVLPVGRRAGLGMLGEQRLHIEQVLPTSMLRLVDIQLLAIKELQERADAIEAEIAAIQKGDEAALRLRKVPGIGLLGATALAAGFGDGTGWRNGRDFSCTLGLVPRHSGTGGKVSIGKLSKRGDPYVRNLLISGARAVLSQKNAPGWAIEMLKRRPFNVVVVALAHKIARTAWALLAYGRNYDRQWQSKPPTMSAA